MAFFKSSDFTEPLQGLKICGACSTGLGIMCPPLFGIELTELPRAPHFSLIANRYLNFGFKLKSKQ